MTGFELLLVDGRLDPHRVDWACIETVVASVAAVVSGCKAPSSRLLRIWRDFADEGRWHLLELLETHRCQRVLLVVLSYRGLLSGPLVALGVISRLRCGCQVCVYGPLKLRRVLHGVLEVVLINCLDRGLNVMQLLLI